MSSSDFQESYSDEGFWDKVKRYAISAGREVIEKALWLYYAAKRPETPVWAKTVAFGALGYFISPIDAIPDTIPVIGYTDDMGVLAAAVAAIASFIDEDVKQAATKKMSDWFGG